MNAAKHPTTVERTSDRELVVTRAFNAPASAVFDAWTKPELLKRWWAPQSLGVTLFHCDVDLRPGGRYRFVFGRRETEAMAFSGVYREVVRPSRLVTTQLFEPIPAAGEAIVTITFTEREGITLVVLHQLFPSKEALTGAVESGMEKGMRVTFDQLEELVAEAR